MLVEITDDSLDKALVSVLQENLAFFSEEYHTVVSTGDIHQCVFSNDIDEELKRLQEMISAHEITLSWYKA